MVAKQHLNLCTLFEHNQYTTVYHQVNVRAQDVDDLNGTVYLDVLGHIDIKAILCQHGVEVSNSIVGVSSHTIVILAGGKVLQGTNDNTFGQMTFGFFFMIEHIVHHEVKARREIGYITTERVVRVDRNL